MTKQKKSINTPKYIKRSAKVISFFSDKLAVQFALRLFVSPIKFPLPNRELKFDESSKKFPLELPKTKKTLWFMKMETVQKKHW